MGKVIKRFRSNFCNKMCKTCRGFNHGDNTHCAWCGDDLSYWNPIRRENKVPLIHRINEDLKNVKKEESRKLFDWGFEE